MRVPRKVLHVLAGAAGGAAKSTVELIFALSRQGVGSAVVCADLGEASVRADLAEATHGAVRYFPLYWWNKKVRVPLWKRPLVEARQSMRTGAGLVSAARVAAMAVEHGVDLIHTNTSLTPEGARAARGLALPHVWHIRELIGPGQPFRFPREGAALGRYLASHASMVVANSRFTGACLADLVPPERLAVVPNGLELSRFRVREAHAGHAPPVVAMVASLSARWKKHALFLDMAERLPPTIELRIYGDVPEGDAHAAALVARAGSRVRLMGRVDDPARIMDEIDVLVQPTDGESFGRVVVEAMAAGLPVVAVRGGGAVEIVDDGRTGLLVPIDDAAALAAAVERVVGDTDWAHALGQAGRARALARFSVEACVASLLDVYGRAMTRPLSRWPHTL